MPYSWGAETPLSNFEIRLDDATRPRQDPAITVLVPTQRTRNIRTFGRAPNSISGLDDYALDSAFELSSSGRTRNRICPRRSTQRALDSQFGLLREVLRAAT